MAEIIGKEGLPIKGDPTKFDKLVLRHGQYVSWYRGSPCYCITFSGSANPECTVCRGVGIRYDLATEVPDNLSVRGLGVKWVNLGDTDASSINEVTSAYYGGYTNTLIVDSIDTINNRIYFTTVVPKHTRVTINYNKSLVKSFSGVGTVTSTGVIEVAVGISDTQGYFVGSIYEVSELNYIDEFDVTWELEVTDKYRNKIFTCTSIPDEVVINVTCTYIEPIIVSIVSVNAIKLSDSLKGDPYLAKVEGWMTYPQDYPISSSDLFETMSAHLIESMVSQDVDSIALPAYGVEKILRVEDEDGLIEGAEIQANNRISWTDREPEGPFSVLYMYNPMFTIIDKEPNLRNYENKAYPKRVGIKRKVFGNIADNRPTAETSGQDDYYA